MSEERKDQPFDPGTVAAILAIVERTHVGLREACLQQSDKDERAKNIEWYRGGAQVLTGLRAEIEHEQQRLEALAKETPEEVLDRNLKVLERAGVNWQLQPAEDADAEM